MEAAGLWFPLVSEDSLAISSASNSIGVIGLKVGSTRLLGKLAKLCKQFRMAGMHFSSIFLS